MPKKAANERGVSKAVITALEKSGGKVSQADKPTRASGRRAARIAKKMDKMDSKISQTGRDTSSARKRTTGTGKKKRAA